MPQLRANGIDLEYESIGDEHAAPLVMIMGLNSQLIVWPRELCAMLAERGFRVILFDNRDVGLSTKPESGYTLDDMADDTGGLIAALGLDDAHVLGASMGGFIAQLVAIRHPERVRSLCIMMSSTGSPTVGHAEPDILPLLLQPAPPERAAYVEHRLAISRRLSSPGYPFDEARLRRVIGLGWDRCYHPLGAQRQLAAVIAGYDRTAALAQVRAPTLVLHGAADPIVNANGSEAIARAIPDARLEILPGMAHDLPEALWPTLTDAIVDNARRGAVRTSAAGA